MNETLRKRGLFAYFVRLLLDSEMCVQAHTLHSPFAKVTIFVAVRAYHPGRFLVRPKHASWARPIKDI